MKRFSCYFTRFFLFSPQTCRNAWFIGSSRCCRDFRKSRRVFSCQSSTSSKRRISSTAQMATSHFKLVALLGTGISTGTIYPRGRKRDSDESAKMTLKFVQLIRPRVSFWWWNLVAWVFMIPFCICFSQWLVDFLPFHETISGTLEVMTSRWMAGAAKTWRW